MNYATKCGHWISEDEEGDLCSSCWVADWKKRTKEEEEAALRAEGYAAAIADVVAWLRERSSQWHPDTLADYIESGVAKGAAKEKP